MVKDEVDIVEDWLKYHGTLFGYNNLYVIDNMSQDGTYEKIKEYEQKGVCISQRPDYRLKGQYMDELINNPDFGEYDFAYPIDIDEFIVYYDKSANKLLPFRTKNYFSTLSMERHIVFKANYIQSIITTGSTDGYKRAAAESTHGVYQDYKHMAKTFINKRKWTGKLDHGNHYSTDNYCMTDLCLVHFHCRNLEQMKKKVINNVIGLGYNPHDINELSTHLSGCGNHHVKHMISILNKRFEINTQYKMCDVDICVNLNPLSTFIRGL
jgi:hypothetical protein